MTHEEKVERYVEDMHRRGVARFTVAPPLYRLLWRLGLTVRPPHFQGFGTLVLVHGVCFGVAFGVFLWFTRWRPDGAPPRWAVFPSLASGLLFGLSMAGIHRSTARKWKLPAWEDYPDVTPRWSPPPR